MNQALQSNPTAQLSINQQGMLSALRNAFSQHSNVVKELAQNARRAGATRFDIHFDKEVDAIEFYDNGCGIKDLRKLLSAADSSWGSQIDENESPYGLGLLAAWFACEEVEITSCEQELKAKTSSILSFEPVDILPLTNTLGVTTIKLKGGVTKLMEINFEELFAGFPVPVFVNYAEISRCEAIDKLEFQHCEIGEVFLHNSAVPSYSNCTLYYCNLIRFYYQGFYIGCGGSQFTRNEQNLKTAAHVVHLDCSQFRAIAPDRHCLIDAEEARTRIEGVVKELIKMQIQSLRNTPEGIQHLLQSYATVAEYGQLQIYNDLEWLPANVTETFTEFPILSGNREVHESEMTSNSEIMSKADIVNGKKHVFANLDDFDDDAHEFKGRMYCWQVEGSMLTDNLDPKHWIYPLLINEESITVDLENESLTLPCNPKMENGLNHYSVFCDQVTLNGPCGPQVVKDSFVTHDRALLMRGDNSNCVVLQSVCFQGEYSYDETYQDLCEDRFSAFFKAQQYADQPSLLIENALNEASVFMPTMIGKTFTLTVSEEGIFSVSYTE